jgi:hypothetical protein
MTTFVKGMILIDEDRREFKVTGATSRIVVIHTMEGRFVESVIHAFVAIKYKVKA